jgi:hypothetical protein
MGKKRKKSQVAPASNPSNEIQISDILESTPAPPLESMSASSSVVPTPPVSRPALTEEKAAEILAKEEKTEPDAVSVSVSVPDSVAAAASVSAPAADSVAAPDSVSVSAPDSVSEPAPDSVASADSVAAAPKKKKKKKRVSRATLDKKIDRLEAKLTEKKEEAAKAAREGFESSALEDETSVPPVDLEVHDDFFKAGEKEHPIPKESGGFSAVDARHLQKMTPHAHARRAHLSRYVKWAVGGAAAILLLGISIKTLRGHPNDEPVHHEVTHVAAVAPPVAQPETTVANAPQVVEVNEVVKADDPSTQADLADAKAPETAETAEKKEDMPAETPKTAYQEKISAKAALERGSNGAAIAAGERSIALDPSDGEAWLVLGGAYQAMGNNGQAKRCYKACVSQGKKGPISDCRDMLGSM